MEKRNCENCGKEFSIYHCKPKKYCSLQCVYSSKDWKQKMKNKNLTHGETKTKFYNKWRSMKRRCYAPQDHQYKHYGGRGIQICPHWQKFENFRDDMYESYLMHVKEHGEKNTTIERIDNNGNYEKQNCRWATIKEQQNNSRNNHFVSFQGKTMTISQWSEELKISRSKLNYRLSINLFPYGKKNKSVYR